MKNKLTSTALMGLLLSFAVLMSCSDDDSVAPPGLVLTEVVSTGMAGDVVSVSVAVTTDAAFESLVVTKLWDGVSQGTQTFDDLPDDEFTFEYTIEEDDAEQILSFNFLLTDAAGNEVSKDWVVTVELTAGQLLVKYDWRLDQEIRELTNENDINEVYADDVYRFNADGTYTKSNNDTKDDFGDLWYNYCYYDINNSSLRLLMHRTGAFLEDVVDTLDITMINDTELIADVTYYDLDAFNTGNEEVPYQSVEEYEKIFVAVAKGATFDPYGSGAEDDGGPAGTCNEVTFEND